MTQPIGSEEKSGPTGQVSVVSDIVGRASLIALMIFVSGGCLGRMAALSCPFTTARFLEFLSEFGIFLFAMLVGVLTVIRLPPRRAAAGWGAVASALGGAFVLTVISYLPSIALPFGLSLLSVTLLAIGNIGTVYCLAHLGRSFSVLPQARSLVRSGPYGHLRHPLYVVEAIATIGMILPHFGWIALGVGLAQFALQWKRIVYEEAVLSATFADYADYAASTPRFFPRWKWSGALTT